VYNLQLEEAIRQAEMIVIGIKEHFYGFYGRITPRRLAY
jgi:hypothetical protein